MRKKIQQHDVLNLLAGTDRLHTVQGQAMAMKLGLRTDCLIRQAVHALRVAGHPIASGDEGYWLAREPGELASTIEHMSNRIKGIQAAIEGLRRAEYGQL